MHGRRRGPLSAKIRRPLFTTQKQILVNDSRGVILASAILSGAVADGTKLYAAPLSPDHSGGGAGVVLPERLPMRPYQTVDKGSTNYKAGFNAAIKQAEELNACLDKVKELNQ
jgi:hypothetical protein